MKNNDFNKLIAELLKVVPQEWDKIVLYSKYTEGSYNFKFFVKNNGKYLDCFDIESIGEEKLLMAFMKFDQIISPARETLPKNARWSIMTIVISNDGNFNADFDYDDMSENGIEYYKAWKVKYLNS